MAKASYCSNHNQLSKNTRRLHYFNILHFSSTRKVLEEENKYIIKMLQLEDFLVWVHGGTWDCWEFPWQLQHGQSYRAATIILNMPGEKGVFILRWPQIMPFQREKSTSKG